MELIVLGSDGGWPRAAGAASGYLLRHDGFTLWIDCGTGTLANLLEHVDLLDVGALAISHQHPDHFLDLYPFFNARRFHPDRPAEIPVFAPPGLVEHAGQLEDKIHQSFRFRVIEPGESFEAGPFTVRTAPMAHPPPTLGMRVTADGAVLAYTADTGPTDQIDAIGRDATVLICECSWLERPGGADPIHLTAAEACQHAARAGAGRLLLTHVWPYHDRDAIFDRASTLFDGPVELARPSLSLTV